MINVIRTKDMKVSSSDTFIFDTNVLLRIFYTNGSYIEKEVNYYNDLLASIITKNAQILLPSYIFSEFTTVMIHEEYKRINNQDYFSEKEFKDSGFRLKSEFNDIKSEISAIFANLNHCSNIVDDSFNYDVLTRVVNRLHFMDFTDSLICTLAESNDNCYIVTHDHDFFSTRRKDNYSVVTCNQKLLDDWKHLKIT